MEFRSHPIHGLCIMTRANSPEDDVKSLDTMMEKDLGDGVYNFGFPMTDSWYVEAFYFGAGCTLFGDGTDPSAGCDFDSEAGIAATQYMVDLAANPKFTNNQDGSCLALFQEGKLGAFCSGSWDAAAIREALGDNFGAVKTSYCKHQWNRRTDEIFRRKQSNRRKSELREPGSGCSARTVSGRRGMPADQI